MHYEGLLQKLIGFNGLKTSSELAQYLLELTTKFCEENEKKGALGKYKLYLPVARWVKVAAGAVLKQEVMSKLAAQVKQANSKLSNAAGELKELAEMCKEWQEETVEINGSLAEIETFIKAVTLSHPISRQRVRKRRLKVIG